MAVIWFLDWGVAEWSLVVAVLALLGFDGRNGWKVIRWILRGFRPAPPPEPQPVRVVPTPPKHSFPAIRPPGARNVIGRAEEFQRLCTLLDMGTGAQITSKGAALQGEGGRGKSTLARYYAEARKTYYEGGLWVPAQDRVGMFDALAGFGHSAFDLQPPTPVTEAHIRAVLDKIAACAARLLFVFDNVDDYKMVAPWLPQGPKIHVILTTRITAEFEGFKALPLDVLDHDTPDSPAVDLLLQEAGHAMAPPEARAEAWGLAKELGGFPLALVIAGGLVKEGAGFADLQTRVAEIIATEPVGQDYPTSVLAAVTLSYEVLSDDAKALADICAWWAPEGIEERLFTDAPGGQWWDVFKDEVNAEIQALVADPSRVRAALRDLRQRSFLQAEEAGGSMAMHRLTATVLRQIQGAAAQGWARAGAAVLMAVYPGGARSPQHPDQWPDCRRLTPHALALWEAAEVLWQGLWEQPDWAAMDALLHQCGVYLSSQGDRGEELVAKEAALRLTEARLGEEVRDIPLALGNLGLTLSLMGQFEAAQARLDRAVALSEAHRPESADMAGFYMQRANLELRRKEARQVADLAQAEAWIVAARELLERLLGAESEDVARCWNELGYLRRLQGRGAEVAEHSERAWTILRGLSAVNDNALSAYAMNTGSTWLEAGEAARAEAPLREAHGILAEIFASRPDNEDRRGSAGWLISCLYTLARAGDDPAARRAEAAALCAVYGFDPAERESIAKQYPIAPSA